MTSVATAEQLFAQDLAKSGLKVTDLDAYLAQETELASVGIRAHLYMNTPGVTTPGYVIPYYDLAGQRAPFYRVKLFRPLPKGARYLQPQNSGSWMYFPKSFGNLARNLAAGKGRTKINGFPGAIIITEGEKKAAKACLEGFPTCAVGGVYNWRTRTVILPEGTQLMKNRDNQIVAKMESGTSVDPTSDRRAFLAGGLESLIKFVTANNLQVVIAFDTDNPRNNDVEAAAAELAFELRIHGIPTNHIRQLHLPTEEGGKMGLDDFLLAHKAPALDTMLTQVCSARNAFPAHPNLKALINKRMGGNLARNEAKELSLMILSDMDRHGSRMVEKDTNSPFFFDGRSRTLLRVNLLQNHSDPLHESGFGKFLYKNYDAGQADLKLVQWLAAGFTGEEPVSIVEPRSTLALLPGNRLAHQLDDGHFILVSGDPKLPAVVCENGQEGLLFKSDQVESIDKAKLIQEVKKQLAWLESKPSYESLYWPQALKSFRFSRDSDTKILSVLSYMSPWLLRWNGAQLPVELMIGEPGSGKDQSLSCKILTPTGWSTMGEMSIGQEVITPTGKVSRVIAVHPQGLRDVYKVTFHDGSSTECGEGHLWKVQSHNDRQHESRHLRGLGHTSGFEYAEGATKGFWKVKPLKDILAKPLRIGGSSTERFHNHIPLISEGLDLTPPSGCTQPLDPYLMGALLGDGSFRTSTPGFTSIDQFVLDKVASRLPEEQKLARSSQSGKSCDYRIQNGAASSNLVRDIVTELGLWGHLSPEKFIPAVFKWTTSQNRLELLQGLMDTDGTAVTPGAAVFNTSSERLKEDVIFLVQSLGGRATCSLRTAPLKNGTGLLAYNVQIRMPLGVCPFTLPHKVAYYGGTRHQKPLRAIDKIEYIGKKETQCITIDDPEGLYITDDFIVTHNSSLYSLRLQVLNGRPALRNQPTDVRDWYASIVSQDGLHVIDNVHMVNKELRQRLSDEICRIVTEPAPFVEMRKLFTTTDNYRLPVRTSFAFTAIQQPFMNADILQRSLVFELQAIGKGHDSDWAGGALKQFGGRVSWLAHQLAVMHIFFKRINAGAWDSKYKSGHRLAHFEQMFRILGSIIGLPDVELVGNMLSGVAEAQVSEYDWTMEALKQFAAEHYASMARNPKAIFTLQNVSEWAQSRSEFAQNQIVVDARRLARYIKSHKYMVEQVCGFVPQEARYGNRDAYRLTQV